MLKVLVPIDGSANSERVIDQVIQLAKAEGEIDLHLINVQIPVETGHARMLVGAGDIDAWYREEGNAALKSVRAKLEAAGVPYTCHLLVGRVADTLRRYAEEKGFDKVIMGSQGSGPLTHLLLGSVATDVVRHCKVPVTLVK